MTKTEDTPMVAVTLCVAMSESGSLLCAIADTNHTQKEQEHKDLLKRVREDNQLWSVKYIRTLMSYPTTLETQK